MCMRIHITLDEELVKTIDGIAGKRGRSAFIRDAVAAEAERRRKMKAFWAAAGSVPDFAPWMTAEWISEDRKRDSEAVERKLAKHWNAPRHDSPGRLPPE